MAALSSKNNTPAKLSHPKILQWNSNSRRRRHAELGAYLTMQDYDVVCRQETYCFPSECKLPGFSGYPSAARPPARKPAAFPLNAVTLHTNWPASV